MPSKLDPPLIVLPGPGRLPGGVVPAGALVPPGSGGGGAFAALQAHINDPIDAHMAHAIGVDPFYPATGQPILTSVGGVVDGESVLDFINEFKDLIPLRPNSIGFNLASGVTTAIPDWGLLNALGVGTGTAVTGGYANGANVTFSHFLVPTGSTTFAMSGLLFPADRGVIAFYKNTDGNFFNGGATTLVAALSLNDTAPAGIPDSAFLETSRISGQTDYTATNAGIDFFNLTFRLPYLTSYAGHPGTPYGPYSANFYSYQLAVYALASQAVGVGDSQSFLIVHWKETYATSLAAIQPANLTLANLVSSKCYSAVPSGGNFDDNTAAVYNVNRHFVFRDSASATAPTLNTFTSTHANAPATVNYSGVPFINQTTLQFNLTLSANNLFNNSFETGSVDNPPDVPAQFHSVEDPMVVVFTDFGGTPQQVPYYDLHPAGPNPNYTHLNSPQPADIGEYVNPTLAIPTPTAAFTPDNSIGYSTLFADFFKAFTSAGPITDASKKYLYNTFPATGGSSGSSTSVFEGFVDELHRYVSTHTPVGADTIVPTGGNIYNSATSLTVDTNSSQIITNNLVYPQTDLSAAAFYPTGPDYSGLPGGDGVNHLRRHLRAFDTGIPRNTGTLRIRFLSGFGAQSAFTVDASYDGTETTGHITGGMIIQVMVPGVTGWLDIGRAYGDPGVATLDFYGCSTGVSVVGPDIFVTFQTTAFTANNGSGEFPLFVRVSLLNNAAGRALRLDELGWST